jgi:hypothetical protein
MTLVELVSEVVQSLDLCASSSEFMAVQTSIAAAIGGSIRRV